MTNGDYIRSLTDEQLADLFDEMCGTYNPCRFCVTHENVCDYNCAPNVETWLKQEHVRTMTNKEWLLSLDVKQLTQFIERIIDCNLNCPWQLPCCEESGKCASAIWSKLMSNERTSMLPRHEYIKTLSDEELGEWIENYLGIMDREWLKQEHEGND